MAEGKRWDGSTVPHAELGPCAVESCGQIAYTERCNAEGDEDRMHWHGHLHVISPRFGAGRLCPTHAEQARAEWRARRQRR